jgi:predicted ATPase with chaperone activity
MSLNTSTAQDVSPSVAFNPLSAIWPPSPKTLDDLGLPDPFLRELAIKILHYSERLTVSGLATRMRVPRHIVDEITRDLRREKLCEFIAGTTHNYENVPFRLTDLGQQRAADAMQRSRYAGPVPVPLDQYNKVIEALMASRQRVQRDRLKESLSHLVFAEETLEAVCAALHSGRAALIYGPTGNGKTEVVTSFASCLQDGTIVPHAIYAYGQVMKAFDRLHHITMDFDEPESVNGPGGHDQRWVSIRTPVVLVGGELTRDALELGYDEGSGLHQFPPHLKAQNGFFVVDDFGRQKMRPDEMLNRWIVPMERSIDMFALTTGEILTIPFDVTLVLSTNLQPSDLMDEALQRRIPYKVQIFPPSPQEFWQILTVNARQLGVECDRAGVDHLMQKTFNGERVPRACLPRDLLRIIIDGATFYGGQPRLTPESVDRAWELYFGPEVLGRSSMQAGPLPMGGRANLNGSSQSIPRSPVPR